MTQEDSVSTHTTTHNNEGDFDEDSISKRRSRESERAEQIELQILSSAGVPPAKAEPMLLASPSYALTDDQFGPKRRTLREHFGRLVQRIRTGKWKNDMPRRVFANAPEKNKGKHASNFVTTSKYTWWNFVFKNLFFQFQRVANCYFLGIAILQLIPGLTPTGKYGTIAPLAFVLLVTAIKELIEDWKRHRQDQIVNNRIVSILRDQKEVRIKWKQLTVGDIVLLRNDDLIPADCVLLSSSEPYDVSYIETCSLDGETNLKLRQAITATGHLRDLKELSDFKGYVDAEEPNDKIYNFQGALHLNDNLYALDPTQILLRGAALRNTRWASALVLFTGDDTKIVQNSRTAPLKRSNVERITDWNVLFIFVVELILVVICTIGFAVWKVKNDDGAWYLRWQKKTAPETARQFFTFIILLNNLIPISLYVSVEICRIWQAVFVNLDLEMYYKPTDTWAVARTSTINEELGQVQFIFSDKTGTLTQNQMEFRKFSIGGKIYDGAAPAEGGAEKLFDDNKNFDRFVSFDTTEFLHDLNQAGNNQNPQQLNNLDQSSRLRENLLCLALCHTCIPEHPSEFDLQSGFAQDAKKGKKKEKKKNKEPVKGIFESQLSGDIIVRSPETMRSYQSASPDEIALVAAARSLGYVFWNRTPTELTLSINGVNYTYELLNTLEFTSARRRMSVVVRTPEGNLRLYCKGADTVILERLSPESQFINETQDHLAQFGNEGLRTLCLAAKDIEPNFYAEWAKHYFEASISLSKREELFSNVAEEVEQNLSLIGSTAIEDKLQDKVPETISILREAGMKIWVLTGDKQETAINIGYSCALLHDQLTLMILNKNTPEDADAQIDEFLQDRKPSKQNAGKEDATQERLGLVIDGYTLTLVLKNPKISKKFLELAMLCESFICCRVTPVQKASIVKLVKENYNKITLAIGDGANDVPMIQSAHVGVGISGVEGMQAARSADYSIAQFKFLQPLLLKHGYWNYRRIVKVILYCFYKNMILFLCQFWFSIFNGWSAQTLYEQWTLSAYNVIFTSLPICFFGCLDQEVPKECVYKHPQLYRLGQSKYYFNFRVLWGWILNSFYHSLITFGFVFLFLATGELGQGEHFWGLWTLGVIIYLVILLIITGKIALETNYWTVFTHIVVWGSVLVFFLFETGYTWVPANAAGGGETFWAWYILVQSPVFWLTIIIIPVIALLRDFIWKFVKRNYFPEPYHILQQSYRPEAKKKSKSEFNV